MTLREVNRVGEGQKNVPKLRFKGYEDAWEQRKLGEEVQIVMGQSPKGENYTDNPEDYILVQGNADMKDGKVFPRVWTTQVTKQAHKGDIILSVRAPVGDIGKTNYDVVIGRGVAAVKGNEFFYQLLGKLKLDGYWTKSSTGSTFDSINSNEIKNAKVTIPDTNEQLFIGDYFQGLDNLITLHQRKYDALKTMKKTLLSKMFPKDGEDVPEIRFKGFTDAWEQRMLPDFVEFYNGQTYTPADVQEFGTLVLRSSNIRNGEVIDADNVYINSEKATAEQVKEGDIIVVVRNGSRALIGKHAEIKENMPNTVIGAFMTGLRSGQPSFLNALLETTQFEQEIEKNMGATINQITGYMFSKMSFMTTGENEQEAVGNYFKEIDNLITLHQRKLDELKNIKKTLLQQMFV